MAVDPASYRTVTSFVFSGEQGDPAALANRLAAGNTVFISSVLSEKYGLGAGDTIRLATRRGERDFEIIAVVVDFYNQGLVIQGSWKDLRRYFGINNVSAFMLKAEAGQSPRSGATVSTGCTAWPAPHVESNEAILPARWASSRRRRASSTLCPSSR